MGGKRRAQPSGSGKAAVSADVAADQGGASRKRQTRGVIVGGGAGSAEARSCGQEQSGSISPVTMGLSMRFDPSTLAGRKAALEVAVEAAVGKVVAEFGGGGSGWSGRTSGRARTRCNGCCRVSWITWRPKGDRCASRCSTSRQFPNASPLPSSHLLNGAPCGIHCVYLGINRELCWLGQQTRESRE